MVKMSCWLVCNRQYAKNGNLLAAIRTIDSAREIFDGVDQVRSLRHRFVTMMRAGH